MTRPSNNQPEKENFAVPGDLRVKLKENEKKDESFELANELKKKQTNKPVEHESDADTNYNWCSRYSHQRIGTRTGRLGNKRMSGDHQNYSIFKIGQNTGESPGDLRLFDDTLTPVRNHRLTLEGKIRKRAK